MTHVIPYKVRALKAKHQAAFEADMQALMDARSDKRNIDEEIVALAVELGAGLVEQVSSSSSSSAARVPSDARECGNAGAPYGSSRNAILSMRCLL